MISDPFFRVGSQHDQMSRFLCDKAQEFQREESQEMSSHGTQPCLSRRVAEGAGRTGGDPESVAEVQIPDLVAQAVRS